MDSDANAGAFPRRWRVSRTGRAGAALVMIAFIGGALFTAVNSYRAPGDGPYDRYFVALLLAFMGSAIWRGSFYPYVEADIDGLTVRNPLRTSRIKWNQIRDVSPGYNGLSIQTENGRSVTAWAVQEANIANWLKRPTRPKKIANQIKHLSGL